jgi:hypothetical protein
MKFRRYLTAHIWPPWKDCYIHYSELKKLLVQASQAGCGARISLLAVHEHEQHALRPCHRLWRPGILWLCPRLYRLLWAACVQARQLRAPAPRRKSSSSCCSRLTCTALRSTPWCALHSYTHQVPRHIACVANADVLCCFCLQREASELRGRLREVLAALEGTGSQLGADAQPAAPVQPGSDPLADAGLRERCMEAARQLGEDYLRLEKYVNLSEWVAKSGGFAPTGIRALLHV